MALYEGGVIDPTKVGRYDYELQRVLNLIIAGKVKPSADERKKGYRQWVWFHPDQLAQRSPEKKADPLLADVFNSVARLQKLVEDEAPDRENAKNAVTHLKNVAKRLLDEKSARYSVREGKRILITEEVPVNGLLSKLNVTDARVVLVNGENVPQRRKVEGIEGSYKVVNDNWDHFKIKAGDDVEIITEPKT